MPSLHCGRRASGLLSLLLCVVGLGYLVVWFVRRGPAANPLMTATYAYFANGLVNSVTYGNGTQTTYLYDVANRVTRITHYLPGGTDLLKLDYTYTDHDLVATIAESGFGGSLDLGTVTFVYDNRSRLIHEYRLFSAGGLREPREPSGTSRPAACASYFLRLVPLISEIFQMCQASHCVQVQ